MGPTTIVLLILSPLLFGMLSLFLLTTIPGTLIEIIILLSIAYLYVRFDDKHSQHEQYDGKKHWDYGPSLERFIQGVKKTED